MPICKSGDDIIALIALTRDCSLKDAAREIDTHFACRREESGQR